LLVKYGIIQLLLYGYENFETHQYLRCL